MFRALCTYLIYFLRLTISSSIEKLQSILKQIGDSTADLANTLNKSEWIIREHCDSQRLQVDISRETAIENIHAASNKLMSEIDAYERECLSGWTTVRDSTEVIVDDVSKRMRAFIAEQQAFLQSLQAS